MLRWLSKYIRRIDIFGVGVELREQPDEPKNETTPRLPTKSSQQPQTKGSLPNQNNSQSMSADEVIATLVSQGGRTGATAQAGSSYFQSASRVRFVLCQCSVNDESYGCREYIARTSRGGCIYISLNLRTRLITCGPKGYHWCRENFPECI